MRLHTFTRQVVKGGGVLDLTIVQPTRQVGDAIGDGIPGTVALIIGTVGRGINRNAALDEGIEVNHVEVVLEEGDGLGAADGRWEGRDGGEGGALRHGCGSCTTRESIESEITRWLVGWLVG